MYVQFVTNIYEICKYVVNFYGMAVEKVNDLRKEMSERTYMGERNEKIRYNKLSNRIKSSGITPFSGYMQLEV